MENENTGFGSLHETLDQAVTEARKLDQPSHIRKRGEKFHIGFIRFESICSVYPNEKKEVIRDFNRPDNGTV